MILLVKINDMKFLTEKNAFLFINIFKLNYFHSFF